MSEPCEDHGLFNRAIKMTLALGYSRIEHPGDTFNGRFAFIFDRETIARVMLDLSTRLDVMIHTITYTKIKLDGVLFMTILRREDIRDEDLTQPGVFERYGDVMIGYLEKFLVEFRDDMEAGCFQEVKKTPFGFVYDLCIPEEAMEAIIENRKKNKKYIKI